jgi:hypothetical protein
MENKDSLREPAKCSLCGEPMPEGEEMFNYHGYSGDCPRPPLKKESFEERFNKIYPPVSVGYDGDEQDAVRREKILALVKEQFAAFTREVEEVMRKIKESEKHTDIKKLSTDRERDMANQGDMYFNYALTHALTLLDQLKTKLK